LKRLYTERTAQAVNVQTLVTVKLICWYNTTSGHSGAGL